MNILGFVLARCALAMQDTVAPTEVCRKTNRS